MDKNNDNKVTIDEFEKVFFLADTMLRSKIDNIAEIN